MLLGTVTAICDDRSRWKRGDRVRVSTPAGVSTATVSRYVNGLQRFTEATETRLREAIAQLGFSVDPVARSMITGRTQTVAVVIPGIRNPHFTGIVKGANRKAQQLGYNLLFVDAGERQSAEAGMLRELSRRMDGLLVSSRMGYGAARWDAERKAGLTDTLREAGLKPCSSVRTHPRWRRARSPSARC